MHGSIPDCEVLESNALRIPIGDGEGGMASTGENALAFRELEETPPSMRALIVAAVTFVSMRGYECKYLQSRNENAFAKNWLRQPGQMHESSERHTWAPRR